MRRQELVIKDLEKHLRIVSGQVKLFKAQNQCFQEGMSRNNYISSPRLSSQLSVITSSPRHGLGLDVADERSTPVMIHRNSSQTSSRMDRFASKNRAEFGARSSQGGQCAADVQSPEQQMSTGSPNYKTPSMIQKDLRDQRELLLKSLSASIS